MTYLPNVNATIVNEPIMVSGETKTDRYEYNVDELSSGVENRLNLDRTGELQVGSGKYLYASLVQEMSSGDNTNYNVIPAPASGAKLRIYNVQVSAVNLSSDASGFYFTGTGLGLPFFYHCFNFDTTNREGFNPVNNPIQLGYIELPEATGLDIVGMGLGSTGSVQWNITVLYRVVSI